MFPGPERSSQRTDSSPDAFRVPERIPLFPLPNVVLFPRTYLPLHIFEPRYRHMVTDVTDGGHCIGMVLLKEGWEPEYYGHPSIYRLGCVGRLVGVQKLPDGRSNILLQGIERFEVEDEYRDRSYREARIALKPRPTASSLDPALREQLVTWVRRYIRARGGSSTMEALFRDGVADDVMVHTVSSYLDCTMLEKQFLLEAESLQRHARRLKDLIEFKLHERQDVKGWG